MPDDKKPQVFLSYASENQDMVRKVYEGLVKRGLNVWFDKENLGPGKWKPQIERAIRRSRYFIICLSNAAIKKTGDEPGFQDHELNEAYEIARNQPEQEFTIVPVRLEDCHRGDHRLTLFQQYDLFESFDGTLDKLAIHMGGTSLRDPSAKDERTTNEILVDELLDKAATEFYAGNFAQSIALVESVIVLSPTSDFAWIYKGSALTNLNRAEEAIRAFDQALQINKNSSDAWYNKGVVLYNLGRLEEALQAYDQALVIDPDDSETLNNKGAALWKSGRIEEAIRAYDQALKIKPDHVSAWNNKGVVLKRLNKFQEAIDAYDKALKIKPDFAETWFNKAAALRSLGKLNEALQAYDRGLGIKPDEAKAVQLRDELKEQIHTKK